MNIDTKQIKKGVVTIDGQPIGIGMSLSEIEQILQKKIGKDRDYVGYEFNGMFEDDNPMSITIRFKGDTVKELHVNVLGFHSEDSAFECLDEWLEERGITEWIGDSYYKTDFGSLIPSVVRKIDRDSVSYELCMSLNYEEVPERKFLPIEDSLEDSVKFEVDGSLYKIQRIPSREADELPLMNWLGNEPQSLHERNDTWSKNDRKEVIYFNVSIIENNVEKVIGVAEFTYLAILEAYKNGELFYVLDGLTEGWGIIGYVVDKYGCGMRSNNSITPYLLVYEALHDEVPCNIELKEFVKDEHKLKSFFDAASSLTTRYVGIPEKNITLIEVSKSLNSLLPYHKTVEDIFINYRRCEKYE